MLKDIKNIIQDMKEHVRIRNNQKCGDRTKKRLRNTIFFNRLKKKD